MEKINFRMAKLVRKFRRDEEEFNDLFMDAIASENYKLWKMMTLSYMFESGKFWKMRNYGKVKISLSGHSTRCLYFQVYCKLWGVFIK